MVNIGPAVTDPNLIARLEGTNPSSGYLPPNIGPEVTDPNLIARLEETTTQPTVSQPIQSNFSGYLNNAVNNLKNFTPNFQNIKNHLTTPQLPIGINVISGLMSGLMPQGPQQQIMRNLPEIAMGQQPNLSQNIFSGIGSSLPAIATGGENLLGQAASGGLIGAAQAPSGERLKSGVENALSTLLLGNVIPKTTTLLQSIKPKDIAEQIQSVHDSLNKVASDGFQYVSKSVKDRGINTVPIDQNYIDEARDLLPKSKANSDLLDDASSGDFDAIRKLQTNLWQRGTKRMTSQFGADNDQGELMFDLRDRINNGISNHLINTGNEDLNNLLNDSRKNYALLQEYFYNKNLPNAIPNLVQEGKRIKPNNMLDVIQTDSEPMNNLKNYLLQGSFNTNQNKIVNLPSIINAIKTKQNALRLLKVTGLSGGILGGLATGLAAAYHFLKPNHPNSGNNTFINNE